INGSYVCRHESPDCESPASRAQPSRFNQRLNHDSVKSDTDQPDATRRVNPRHKPLILFDLRLRPLRSSHPPVLVKTDPRSATPKAALPAVPSLPLAALPSVTYVLMPPELSSSAGAPHASHS